MEQVIYIVVREGIYDQGVFGVYGTKDKAVVALARAYALERDDYHDFEIRKYVLNVDVSVDDGDYEPEIFDYQENK